MILYFNADEGLTKEVNSLCKSKNKDYSSVFIDWIPTKKAVSQKKASNLLSQTDILEKYVKTLPIVIFDRYRSITTEEYSWLKKFKVTFFEPAILVRNGFKYLPNWIKIKELNDIKLNETKRSVNIGYIGALSDKSKSFDKYYVKTKINNPDIKMCYYTTDVNKDKESEYQNLDIIRCQDLLFSDMEFTVIIGNANDYVVGHLDQYYIKALENNCIPILPKENRYYSALPFNICNTTWYDAYVNMYDKTYVGFIHDIYTNIKKYYPEMNITYTAEIVKRYLEEK